MPCIVSLPPHTSFHPYILPSPSSVRPTPLEKSRGAYQNSRESQNAHRKMDFSSSSLNASVEGQQDWTLPPKGSIPSLCSSNSLFISHLNLKHSVDKFSSNPPVPSSPIVPEEQWIPSATNTISQLTRENPSCPPAPSLLALTKPAPTASCQWAERTSTAPLKQRSEVSRAAVDSSQTTRSVISYLKAWRPPVEYYARRRRHPSLAYPSRRPMLPALLEEQVMPGGHLGLVRADLAIRSSSFRTPPRSGSCRCLAGLNHSQRGSGCPSCASVQETRITMPGLGGWDDESDEDELHQLSEGDEDDDEEDDYWSESDIAEAVTPVSSPGSPSGFILQPLFLTKPPGC